MFVNVADLLTFCRVSVHLQRVPRHELPKYSCDQPGNLFDETVNETSIRGEIRGVFVDVFEELEQKRHLRVKNGVVELRDIERCVVFEGRLSMGEKVVEGGYKRGFSIRKVEMGGRRRRRVAERRGEREREREKRNRRREKARRKRKRAIQELDRWLFFPMCNLTCNLTRATNTCDTTRRMPTCLVNGHVSR